MVPNSKNELFPMKIVTRWRVCMVYLKLNVWKEMDHFEMSSMDQILDCLASRVGIDFLMGILAIIRSP